MHIYALSIEKGGCGKTALAVNLAAAFQQLGLRVLLIDLDAQANATHWLGLDPTQVPPEQTMLGVLNDAMQGRIGAGSLRDRVLPTPEQVDVLAAQGLMAAFPAQLSAAPLGGLFLLRDALAALPDYDIVVLDLPPARGPVLATALAAATRCLAPVQPEDLVMRALRALQDSVSQIHSVNPGLQLSVVRNKYAVRSAADRIFDQALQEHHPTQLLPLTIPIRAALRDSAALQQSIFRASGSDAAEVRNLFFQLVDHLITLDGQQPV
jgi:chromosome partitioning protein